MRHRSVILATLVLLAGGAAQADDALLPLDHFLCYGARAPRGVPKFTPVPAVTLRDQFEKVVFELRKPTDICNPAKKRQEPVFDERTHLKAYLLKPARGERKPVPRGSLVKDQFHPNGLRVITKRAQFALVPTSKSLGTEIPPPPDPAAHAVDHYACYRAKLPRGAGFVPIGRVKVEDQFLQPKLVDLKSVRWLCNPADKYWQGRFEPREMPQRHLLCYTARPSKGEPKHASKRVIVNNQFGPEVLETTREDVLCVPAEKSLTFPPPACGDGAVNQASETCDGADDNACPGACRPDCTCPPPPRCGDGAVNQPGEECDPPGSACAGGFGTCDPTCKCIETDEFPATTAQVEIRFPDGSQETVDLAGPTKVEVRLGGLADNNGNGREEVETEMLQLDLVGSSPRLGPLALRLSPTMPTRGAIEENVNATPGVLDLPPFAAAGTAASFFDVFFEVEVGPAPGLVLHNQQPKRMSTTITHKPPATGETYEDPTPIPLFDANNQPTGISVVGTRHTPNPATCGNGVLDPGEPCDPSAGAYNCQIPGGHLGTCTLSCTCSP